MTTRRLVFRAACAIRRPLQTRPSTRAVEVCGIRSSSTGPATITDAGFWRSLIPKPFRKENRPKSSGTGAKEWNPATFFIVMFLFIGSMSIQMIALRKQSERYDRQSTVRMGQLREALRRLEGGHAVDVEKILGRADAVQRDSDWEEMWKALEDNQPSQSIDRQSETETTARPEVQMRAAAREQTTIQDVQVHRDVGSASFTTKSNLGNFF
ncbi:hypothetical protein E4U43_007780 [Claviceps pusilla]|uniref:Uncharacterized protein n=1 Tax=Claviceps pusilla TaxID=123648 RepID=A0A9P7NC23_9HYPO|nr:hypothetical protein E4U43_007780 [Claviceps pusilla]